MSSTFYKIVLTIFGVTFASIYIFTGINAYNTPEYQPSPPLSKSIRKYMLLGEVQQAMSALTVKGQGTGACELKEDYIDNTGWICRYEYSGIYEVDGEKVKKKETVFLKKAKYMLYQYEVEEKNLDPQTHFVDSIHTDYFPVQSK